MRKKRPGREPNKRAEEREIKPKKWNTKERNKIIRHKDSIQEKTRRQRETATTGFAFKLCQTLLSAY